MDKEFDKAISKVLSQVGGNAGTKSSEALEFAEAASHLVSARNCYQAKPQQAKQPTKAKKPIS